MNNKPLALVVFLLLCVACLGQALWYYPQLPAEVACHFGLSGQPDAWCGKLQFLRLHLITVAIVAGMFLGFGLALPRLPAGFINLPNKDYWLAPERRRQTMDYMMSRHLWLGVLTIILLLNIFWQSYQVHLGHAEKLSHVWLYLGIYLAAVAAWGIAIVLKFKGTE